MKSNEHFTSTAQSTQWGTKWPPPRFVGWRGGLRKSLHFPTYFSSLALNSLEMDWWMDVGFKVCEENVGAKEDEVWRRSMNKEKRKLRRKLESERLHQSERAGRGWWRRDQYKALETESLSQTLREKDKLHPDPTSSSTASDPASLPGAAGLWARCSSSLRGLIAGFQCFCFVLFCFVLFVMEIAITSDLKRHIRKSKARHFTKHNNGASWTHQRIKERGNKIVDRVRTMDLSTECEQVAVLTSGCLRIPVQRDQLMLGC